MVGILQPDDLEDAAPSAIGINPATLVDQVTLDLSSVTLSASSPEQTVIVVTGLDQHEYPHEPLCGSAMFSDARRRGRPRWNGRRLRHGCLAAPSHRDRQKLEGPRAAARSGAPPEERETDRHTPDSWSGHHSRKPGRCYCIGLAAARQSAADYQNGPSRRLVFRLHCRMRRHPTGSPAARYRLRLRIGLVRQTGANRNCRRHHRQFEVPSLRRRCRWRTAPQPAVA